MKLITLNIWGGRVREPLLNFINEYQDIDIFCFQELYEGAMSELTLPVQGRVAGLNIFSELQKLLPNHTGYFRPSIQVYGVGIFIKKNITVLEEGEIIIHHAPNYSGTGGAHSSNMQYLRFKDSNNEMTIMNVHGLWNGQGKGDSPERIMQSEKIKAFMDNIKVPKILCGDFNLRPDTDSLAIVADGMKNLVKAFNVTSTRTSLYGKEEKFADYIFTSPDITVKDFQVLPDEVSDHAPLSLEF